MMPLIIAVDGPAAAGKGTLARRLAAHFGLPHLDTGLLYRAVGRRVLDTGEDPASAASALCPEDLARPDLRTPEAAAASSRVGAIPRVRAALLAFQRNFARDRGAVLDGRDIGTVIFPDARVKLYVTASPEARAYRRWLELQPTGVSLAEVTADMRARDTQDANRASAPMKPASDAMLLDTSTLTADEAFSAALVLVASRVGGKEHRHGK